MVQWTFVVSVSPLGVARAACFEELAGVLSQLLKKVAQAKPKGLLHLFVLVCYVNLTTYFFI